MKRSNDIIITVGGGCFYQELKYFKFNYMFGGCFMICYCRTVNINNCTFIATEWRPFVFFRCSKREA